MTVAAFDAPLRRAKSAAFVLAENSTAKRAIDLELWGRPARIYANANLSIYSGQTCNARCPFCVEELRPLARGVALADQKRVLGDDDRYFAALARALDALAPLDPTTSVTGGEPSLDPRLPRLLRSLDAKRTRKRTLTTNGSGLLAVREGKRVVDWIAETGVAHLNVSRAHPDCDRNAELMGYREGLSLADLREAIAAAERGGARVRLSCVLLRGAIDDLEGVRRYVDFAERLGVTQVIFRQLMQTDPAKHLAGPVVRFSDLRRARLERLLDAVSDDPSFTFVKQIVGYYYYVEVWRRGGATVVFEEASLARLEATKREDPATIHELVFHPNGKLASTWQPWDGVLGPPEPG